MRNHIKINLSYFFAPISFFLKRFGLIPSVLLVSFVLFLSCSYTVTEDEETRESVEEAIIASFPDSFNVTVYAFTNLNDDEEGSDYLSDAIPEMIYSYLKPIETDTTTVDFYSLQFEISDDFEDLVFISNSVFSNYITNVDTWVTQYTYEFISNTNYIDDLTNSNFIEYDLITNDEYTNDYVEILDIQSNAIETNLTQTNVYIMMDGKYLELITNEFPDLTNSLSDLSLVLNDGMDDYYNETNLEKFSVSIYGDYDMATVSSAPSEALINLYVTVFINESNTNTFTDSIKVREDRISDELYGFLALIRETVLNQPYGDLEVVTDPANANVYLDGAYIGKSPLFYPVVLEGEHQITVLKDGYFQKVVEGTVFTNMTNHIEVSLNKYEEGGALFIKSNPSNALVFFDSVYEGVTPIVLSNLSIGVEHRVQVRSTDTNYYPFYYSFILEDTNQVLTLTPQLETYEGYPQYLRDRAWWSAYASWGVTLACVGTHFYSGAKEKYYRELNTKYTGITNYAIEAENASMINLWSFNFGIISTLVSAGLTGNALYRDEVYMGFQIISNKDFLASFSLEF